MCLGCKVSLSPAVSERNGRQTVPCGCKQAGRVCSVEGGGGGQTAARDQRHHMQGGRQRLGRSEDAARLGCVPSASGSSANPSTQSEAVGR